MKKYISAQKGFTLIETLVALAIMSILILSVAQMVVTMSVQERRHKAIIEVDMAASSLMDDITQSIRNANSIASPATSTTSTSTLVLNMNAVTGEDPTTFTFANKTISVARATSTAYRLTNSNVLVNSVAFQNISASSTRGTVRITLNISYNNSGNDPRLNYATTLITSVTLR